MQKLKRNEAILISYNNPIINEKNCLVTKALAKFMRPFVLHIKDKINSA